MIRIKPNIAVVSTLLLLTSIPITTQADLPALTDKCLECHGTAGNSDRPQIPSIAGFSTNNLLDSLLSYKYGDRKGKSIQTPHLGKTDMNRVTQSLRPEEIKALGEFFAKQPFRPATQKYDADLAALGARIHEEKCEECHHDGGAFPEDDTGIIAGQWKPYLERQFELFIANARPTTKKMARRFNTLDESDRRALVEFYASRQQIN